MTSKVKILYFASLREAVVFGSPTQFPNIVTKEGVSAEPGALAPKLELVFQAGLIGDMNCGHIPRSPGSGSSQ